MGQITHGGVGDHLAAVSGGDGALGGGKTSNYIDASDAARVGLLVATYGDLSPGDTITVQFKQAEDDQGTGADDLGDALVFTVPGAGDSPAPAAGREAVIFDKEIAGLTADHDHIGAVVTSSTAVNGVLTFLKGGQRFKNDNTNITVSA